MKILFQLLDHPLQNINTEEFKENYQKALAEELNKFDRFITFVVSIDSLKKIFWPRIEIWKTWLKYFQRMHAVYACSFHFFGKIVAFPNLNISLFFYKILKNHYFLFWNLKRKELITLPIYFSSLFVLSSSFCTCYYI